MPTISIKNLLLIIFAGYLVAGCSALQTFPNTARLGDTVTLALGSHDNLSIDTISSIKFLYSAGGESPELKPYVQSIFRLYADKKSRAYQPGLAFLESIVEEAGHEPWLNVLVLKIPTSAEEPTMATGTGQFQIVTTKDPLGVSDVIYHGNGTPLDSFWDEPADPTDDVIKIAMELLPGSGAANPLAYEFGGFVNPSGGINSGVSLPGNLSLLEAHEHAAVLPTFDGDPGTTWPDMTYGAVQINVLLDTVNPLSDASDLRVVAEDMTVHTGSRRMVGYNLISGPAGNELIVIFLSPEGKLKYYEPRFSIALNTTNNFNSVPTISSVEYYTVDGALLTSGVPGTGDFNVQIRP